MPAICFACREPGHIAADCPEQETLDTRPRWCGVCDPKTRLVAVNRDATEVTRCQECHPNPRQPLAQHRRCPACKMTVHAWDIAACGQHSSPVTQADSRPLRSRIDAITARERAAEDRADALARLAAHDGPPRGAW